MSRPQLRPAKAVRENSVFGAGFSRTSENQNAENAESADDAEESTNASALFASFAFHAEFLQVTASETR
jgi:hypothetical protein